MLSMPPHNVALPKFQPILMNFSRDSISICISKKARLKTRFPINKMSCSLNERWHEISTLKFQLKMLLQKMNSSKLNNWLDSCMVQSFTSKLECRQMTFLITVWQKMIMHEAWWRMFARQFVCAQSFKGWTIHSHHSTFLRIKTSFATSFSCIFYCRNRNKRPGAQLLHFQVASPNKLQNTKWRK